MSMIAVIGGAGYIGSHVSRVLAATGHRQVIIDNFSSGHRWAIHPNAALIEADIHDTDTVTHALVGHGVDAVIHLAARIEVGESVRDPLRCYRNNVAGSLSVISACRQAGVERFVFSSTAAVYMGSEAELTEESPLGPANPYGASKVMIERVLEDCAVAYGLKSVALRYFNAAGADPSGEIGEAHDPETHLVPLIIKTAMGERHDIKVFGTDYQTPDGTAVRDYVHVLDLADAHVRAVEWLSSHRGATGVKAAFNLGTGIGVSVREVIATVKRISGKPIAVAPQDRRAGDAARLVADPTKAQRNLGWVARQSTIDQIVIDALRWHANLAARVDVRSPP